jgi:hypothetical protein
MRAFTQFGSLLVGAARRRAAPGLAPVAVASRLRAAEGLAPLVVAVGLWALAMPNVDTTRMTDLGLISVLPPQVPLAILLIVASAAWHLRRDSVSVPFLTLHLVALVFLLYAMPTVVEAQPRFAATYIHVGISEYISRTGSVAPGLEARFDWPGFFILASFLSQASGFHSTMDLAGWAPVYLNLMYLGPLALIFRSITRDTRLVCAGLFLFELTNWVGQDYFSPQGLNYFLFLSIIGLVVTHFRTLKPASDRFREWLGARRRGARLLTSLYSLTAPEQLPAEDQPPQRQAGLIIAIVVIFAFVAFAHQLTPFFTVAALLALAAFNRITLRGLPILLGVVAVVWVSYMTVPYLSGHLAQLAQDFGQIGKSVGANVSGRVGGSPDHRLVVTLGIVFTLSLWIAAATGFLVRFRDGRRDLSMVLLAAAPVPLVAAQAYGGELVLRLYLFTLPFMAILASGVVYGRPQALPSRLRTCGIIAVCAAITLGFLVTRYGNERMDIMTTSEVLGVQQVYKIAPPGSLLVSPSGNLPWRAQGFEQYTYISQTYDILAGKPADLVNLMRTAGRPHSFLILTASQEAEAELFNGMKPSEWDAFVNQIIASSDFKLVYQNADTKVFELRSPAAAAPDSIADGTATMAASMQATPLLGFGVES